VYARANQWRLFKLLRVLQAGHIQMKANAVTALSALASI
jgi:hypothetical protein